MSLGPELLRECSPPPLCHVSHVKCHLSCIKCQMKSLFFQTIMRYDAMSVKSPYPCSKFSNFGELLSRNGSWYKCSKSKPDLVASMLVRKYKMVLSSIELFFCNLSKPFNLGNPSCQKYSYILDIVQIWQVPNSISESTMWFRFSD